MANTAQVEELLNQQITTAVSVLLQSKELSFTRIVRPHGFVYPQIVTTMRLSLFMALDEVIISVFPGKRYKSAAP